MVTQTRITMGYVSTMLYSSRGVCAIYIFTVIVSNSTLQEYHRFLYCGLSYVKTTVAYQSKEIESQPQYVCIIYHRWNNNNKNKNISTTHPGTNKPTVAANSKTVVVHALTKVPVKDDLSTTHTPKTLCLCTLDTSDPNNKPATTDMLINFQVGINQ